LPTSVLSPPPLPPAPSLIGIVVGTVVTVVPIVVGTMLVVMGTDDPVPEDVPVESVLVPEPEELE